MAASFFPPGVAALCVAAEGGFPLIKEHCAGGGVDVLLHLTHWHVLWTCLPGWFKALVWTEDCITWAGAGILLFVFPYNAVTGT